MQRSQAQTRRQTSEHQGLLLARGRGWEARCKSRGLGRESTESKCLICLQHMPFSRLLLCHLACPFAEREIKMKNRRAERGNKVKENSLVENTKPLLWFKALLFPQPIICFHPLGDYGTLAVILPPDLVPISALGCLKQCLLKSRSLHPRPFSILTTRQMLTLAWPPSTAPSANALCRMLTLWCPQNHPHWQP